MTTAEVARGEAIPRRGERGFLDRFLNIFADVRAGEVGRRFHRMEGHELAHAGESRRG